MVYAGIERNIDRYYN